MGNTIYKSQIGKQILMQYYETYLESFEIEFERVYVETRFGRTHVLVSGPRDAKPVFIFQGGNCLNPVTLSWFSSLLKNYRVYAPDTIGHPGFSEVTRISAQDESFAKWITDLMEYFQVEKAAFIGPSYGGGIILRLAAFKPEKIACSILVAPAGIQLGSKIEMIRKILIPLMFFKMNHSEKHLGRIADRMSDSSMKEMDKQIIGNIFRYTKLEQDMPKLTKKSELANYKAPTLVISGTKDVFFPEKKIKAKAHEIIPNLSRFESYEMGHFPSQPHLEKINDVIGEFLQKHY